MTTHTIESVLHETRLFAPSSAFTRHARISSRQQLEDLRQQAHDNPQLFWATLARENLAWQHNFETVLDESNAPFYRWFSGGKINVSYNCLDRHLETRGHKTAIIYESENGDVRRLSYRDLYAEVCRFANALKQRGIKSGDRVVILMPNTPEAIIAMQSCARIGAIHSVVFGGFSAESLKDRIEDAGATMVITADGGHRAGKIVELKATVDKALSKGCKTIQSVIVLKCTGHTVAMQDGRDEWWHACVELQNATCEPTWVGSEHPLFLLYTSGSTGKPKGIQHSTAGYLLGATVTMQWVFDLQEDDIFWCTADVGWITGHSYVAYGPLSCGATLMMYEGAPTVPDAGRFWRICEKHRVTIFYTAPTAIRALMRFGDAIPAQYDLSRLRLLGSVGEPINPEAWMWYHRVIGGGRCPIVDTWWQTETGAIMIAPVPGAVPTKPGSCTLPLPGIEAAIVDDNGESVTRPEQGGFLVIKRPWPSMARTIWGDDQRYKDTYWQRFEGRYYLAGDGAHCDNDGYFWIMGRIDDVLNVSGHRLGTMEIESALVSHARVAESAVVGRPDPIKGEAVVAFVVLRGSRPEGEDYAALVAELRNWVGEQIGAIAKPDDIRLVDGLPKTRSGKIMRRLLRDVASGADITQDISTLENEAVVKQLQGRM